FVVRAKETQSYTEVAVITSIPFRFFAVAALALLVAGCQQEVISTNATSRQQGMQAFNEGSYADAAGSFRAALRSDPRDYRSQFYLGQSYEQLKQYQQSIQAYKASMD